jgi:hypothetical protein
MWGLEQMTGRGLVAMGIIGLVAAFAIALIDRERAWIALVLALVTSAAVPFVAFLDGHPFRIRYVAPLIAAQAVGAGIAIGASRRAQPLAAVALVVVATLELRPLDMTAPMLVEAQSDRTNSLARQHVTECLENGYRGETILASMGSLAHYMHDLSRVGFRLRDFLHEGNGAMWQEALANPRPLVGWILVSERPDSRDGSLAPAWKNPNFLSGFSRMCEGGGVVLYRRSDVQPVQATDGNTPPRTGR